MSAADPAGDEPRPSKGAKATLLNNRLLAAVHTGSVEVVERLVEDGADVRYITPRSQNLVFTAADRDVPTPDHAESKLAMLTHLIDRHGLDAAMVDHLNQTPLFYAAKYDVQACKYLIEKRGDPRHADNYHQQALFYAARENRSDVVNFLLEQGGNGGQVDLKEQSALFYTKCPKCMDALIQARADPNQQDARGTTPCDLATRLGELDRIKHLIAHRADLNLKDRLGRTCLDLALKYQAHQPEIATTLEKAGALHGLHQDFDARHYDQARHVADLIKHVQDERCEDLRRFLEKLLGAQKDKGKILNVNDRNGQNFMHFAAARQQEAREVCELLIDSSVDLDKEDNIKQTPLYYAVRPEAPNMFAGGVDCARLLLERRADPNKIDHVGDRPLHYAARRADSGCVEALLEARADVSHRNSFGWTAVHVAVRDSTTHIVSLLLNARCDPETLNTQETPLIIPPQKKEVVELLLAWRCNPNQRDKHGRTPVMYAVRRLAVDAVKALIAGGADLSAQDGEGNTSLMIAAMTEGSLDLCRMLIKEYGCSVDVPNAKGQTAAGQMPILVEASHSDKGSVSSSRDRSRTPRSQLRTAAGGAANHAAKAAGTAEPVEEGSPGGEAPESPAPSSPPEIYMPEVDDSKRKKYRMVFEDHDGNEIPYGTERYTRALRAFLRLHPWHDGWGLLQDSRPVFNVDSGDDD